MKIRSLNLRDLALINQYRHQGLFLDSVPTLLWGRVLVPMGAFLSTFSSLTGVFTSIGPSQDSHLPLLGQVVHNAGSPFAHFTFLAPRENLTSERLPEMLEHLIVQVGSRGAHSLIAEVDEQNLAFSSLRNASFGIYARQRIWRLTQPAAGKPKNRWHAATVDDEMAINLLCTSLVPGLVQQVEPSAWDGLRGYVLYRDGELMAYADMRSGPRGKWLQPFVHLDMDTIEEDLAGLVGFLRPSRRSPLYLSLRSYQEWLAPTFKNLGALPGPRQAVMVKRTARQVKAKEGEQLLAAEGRRAEPTMPINLPTSFLNIDHEISVYDQAPNYR